MNSYNQWIHLISRWIHWHGAEKVDEFTYSIIHLNHNKWIHVRNEFIYAIRWIHSNDESIVSMNSIRPANHSPSEASPGYCYWKTWHHRHQHWYGGGQIMEQLVGIFAWEYEVMLVVVPWTIIPPAGGGMTVVAGTEVSAMVDDDRVGRAEAATVSFGTERVDHARDDSRWRTDDAQEVPGSGGVVDLDKELAPAVACAVSWLLWPVGVRGGWLRNMLQIS